jgi:hypothetical protein
MLDWTKRKRRTGKRNGGRKFRFGYVQDTKARGPGMLNRVIAPTVRNRIEAITRQKGEDCGRWCHLPTHGVRVK